MREDVIAFHDAWITPDHATIAIVGDVDAESAFALVKRYFATIKRSSSERARWEMPPRLPGLTVVDVAANVPQAWVQIRWPTASYYTKEDAVLDAVARWLKGNDAAHLYWKLVDDRKVAVGVTVRNRSTVSGSQFEVSLQGAPGKTPEEIATAFDAAMDEIKRTQPTSTEVQSATYETLVNRYVSYERLAVRAGEYAKFAAHLGAAGTLWHEFERYKHISPSVMQQAMIKWLPSDRCVVLLVRPTPGASRGGDRILRRFFPARGP
jgi:predicted Zn-dependent peptidase